MTSGSLPSVKNYRLYIVFQVPWTRLFACIFFCLWLVIGTYILLGFFLLFVYLICEWKYLSFYPQAINYILTIILYFYFSCETTLLMLSCDRFESANFSLSLAKLVYYIFKVFLLFTNTFWFISSSCIMSSNSVTLNFLSQHTLTLILSYYFCLLSHISYLCFKFNFPSRFRFFFFAFFSGIPLFS